MDSPTFPAILWLPCAYLLGAIPTSYLVARAVRGVDLREFGSRSLGATNLYRLLGWGGAVPAEFCQIVPCSSVANARVPVEPFVNGTPVA